VADRVLSKSAQKGRPPEWGRPTPRTSVRTEGDIVVRFIRGTNRSPFQLTVKSAEWAGRTSWGVEMYQVVPTIIVFGLAAMFVLVGLVVGGQARNRTPRHSHRH